MWDGQLGGAPSVLPSKANGSHWDAFAVNGGVRGVDGGVRVQILFVGERLLVQYGHCS